MPTMTAYRNYGTFSDKSPTPINEGAAPVKVFDIDLTGQPNGLYYYQVDAVYSQPVGKFMRYRVDEHGVAGQSVSQESFSAIEPQYVSGWGHIEVTDGTFKLEGFVEFPDQAGSASGTVLSVGVRFERVLEAGA